MTGNPSPLYQNYTTTVNKRPQTQKRTIIKENSGSSTAQNAARRTSCKAWNSPVDHPKFSMSVWYKVVRYLVYFMHLCRMLARVLYLLCIELPGWTRQALYNSFVCRIPVFVVLIILCLSCQRLRDTQTIGNNYWHVRSTTVIHFV